MEIEGFVAVQAKFVRVGPAVVQLAELRHPKVETEKAHKVSERQQRVWHRVRIGSHEVTVLEGG